ncbi:MAG: hypothetical protein K8I27_00120 [Planctomycetes bacterium]|nr:hypothetical protein [Planctomycetota bacterium]
MKKLLSAVMLGLLVGCGSSEKRSEPDDDDPYTQEDLDRDTGDVYRPSDPGKDDDGVDKGGRDKPTRNDRVNNTKEDPKKDPGPSVEKPKDDPGPKDEPKKDPAKDPVAEKPKDDPKKDPEPAKPDRSGLIKAFISDVSARMDDLEESRLWKDLIQAKEKFDASTDKALEKGNDERGKDAEAAWANAIKDWYEVRYLTELFKHVNWSAPSDFYVDGPLNEEVVGACADQHLRNGDCAQAWAAYELIEINMKEVRQFQTDILKYDLVASKVYQDPKQEKKWVGQKDKWQDAVNGTFDKNDLKKYGK